MKCRKYKVANNTFKREKTIQNISAHINAIIYNIRNIYIIDENSATYAERRLPRTLLKIEPVRVRNKVLFSLMSIRADMRQAWYDMK